MKRLFINFSRRLSFALRNPQYTVRSLAHEVLATEERFLAEVSGASVASVRRYLDEPFHNEEFYSHLRRSESVFSSAKIASADFYAKKVVMQYALVRAVKPEVILETGVASGVSTSYLLLALKMNGRGKLSSIELGDSTYLPPRCPPGWLVPEGLRNRWKIYIGDSRILLASVAQELAPLDVFIHDSLHTHDHMLFEFDQAFPFLRPGGIMVADDALWNPAFNEFSARVHATAARVIRGVGVLRKGDG